MNVKRLKEAIERLDDDTEVLIWQASTEETAGTYELTIDTDMRTGEVKLVICGNDYESGNLRDYEHHPGFEDINAWIFEGM